MKQNEHKTSDFGFFPACLSKVLEPPPVRSAAPPGSSPEQAGPLTSPSRPNLKPAG